MSTSVVRSRVLLLGAAFIASVSAASAQAPATSAMPVPAPGRDDPACERTRSKVQCDAEKTLRGTIARESQAIYPYALSGALPTSIKIVAGTDNKLASLNLSIPLRPLASLTVTAAAPLSESESRTSIAQLSELANKGKVGAQLNWGVQRRPTKERASAILSSLQEACKRASVSSHTAPGSGLTESGCDLNTLAGSNAEVQKRLREYLRTTFFLSLKGEVARQKFEFVDQTTFEDDYQTTYPASGGVLVGALFAPTNVFASLGVRWDNGYKEADEKAVCGVPTGVSQVCPVKVVGGPKDKRRGVFEAEVRRFLATPWKYPVGVSAVFRRDWMENETSLETPIYLVKDKDGGLSAGVSLGYVWNSKPNTGGARFAVFVGQTFGLVPRSD